MTTGALTIYTSITASPDYPSEDVMGQIQSHMDRNFISLEL